MRKRREINLFSLSFLDLISGALGAVIILFVSVPKSVKKDEPAPVAPIVNVAELENEIKNKRLEVEQLKQELSKKMELENQIQELKSKEVTAKDGSEGRELDVGFKFKGKKIVFLIDTSGSMVEEDRISQVKAGLKMLITSMSPSYSIDVIQFPYGEIKPFRSLWGEMKPLTTMNKYETQDFIYGLFPRGSTPTRDVLLHVLKNYSGVSDIVLLTDGAPTLFNQRIRDDIYDLLTQVHGLNKDKIQINTIGVGSEFIKDKTSDYRKFLSLLSEQNTGFFVGF